MDSSGTLYKLIEEEMNRRKTDSSDFSCGTMSAEGRKKAIEIFLSAPSKPIGNHSINRFRRIVKRSLRGIFH